MDESARFRARYPLGFARSRGGLAVQAHGEFDGDKRRPRNHELGVRRGEVFRFIAPLPDFERDSRAAQALESAPGHFGVRVADGRHDPRDSRRDDGVGAWRGAPEVGAWL